MKFGKLCAIAILCGVIMPARSQGQIDEGETMAAAPGGDSYRVESSVNGNEEIVQCRHYCAEKRTLLTSKSASTPQANLTGFKNLRLSTDSSTLFFETDAWAVSDAIHAVDIRTGVEHFVTDGSLACIVGTGQFQGDLVVAQHKYFVEGGSYESLFLFTPKGKQIGIVALDSSDAPRFCAPAAQL